MTAIGRKDFALGAVCACDTGVLKPAEAKERKWAGGGISLKSLLCSGDGLAADFEKEIRCHLQMDFGLALGLIDEFRG